MFRRITARYNGTCRVCRKTHLAGQSIYWDTQHKITRCTSCQQRLWEKPATKPPPRDTWRVEVYDAGMRRFMSCEFPTREQMLRRAATLAEQKDAGRLPKTATMRFVHTPAGAS